MALLIEVESGRAGRERGSCGPAETSDVAPRGIAVKLRGFRVPVRPFIAVGPEVAAAAAIAADAEISDTALGGTSLVGC